MAELNPGAEYSDAEVARAADQMTVVLARRLQRCRKIQIGVNSPLAETAGLMAARLSGGRTVVYLHAMLGAHYVPERTSLFASELDAVRLGSGFPIETLLDRLTGDEGVEDEPLHPLQIDALGRVNLTGIRGPGGPLAVQGPGTAGLDLLAYLPGPRATLYTTRHGRRTFVPRVDLTTGWGPEDPSANQGPVTVVTDLAVLLLGPDRLPEVVSRHDWVEADTIRAATGFDLQISANVAITLCPSAEELALLDHIDPDGLRRIEFAGSAVRWERVRQAWAAEAGRE